MAHSSASKKSNTDDSNSYFKEEVNHDPSFLVAENARLNDLLTTVMMCLERPTSRTGSISLRLERIRRRWLS
jgi:hypothetical protein